MIYTMGICCLDKDNIKAAYPFLFVELMSIQSCKTRRKLKIRISGPKVFKKILALPHFFG